MIKLVRNLFIPVFTLMTLMLHAQSKLGIQHINYERWRAAEAEFGKSNAPEDVFYKGFAQLMLEKNDEAKATFNSIASEPFGKIGLGWLELNAKNTEGANKLFEEAAKDSKNKNPEVFVAISRAIVNSKAEDKSTAIEWAKKAVDKANTNPEYRIVYGDAYLSTVDGGGANNQYEYAQQYAPNTALPYAKIGMVYYRMKVYDQSLTNLKKAFEIDPNNLLALNYLAQTYYRYRVYDTAEMYQKKLIELGNKEPEDMAMLANIYFLGKKYDDAINLINEIIQGDNKFNYLNRLIGYSYYETGKYQDAVNALENFFTSQPKDKIVASDYEYLGKAYIALGDKEKGTSTIQKAVELNPNDKDALKAIADNFKKMKMYPEALEYYKKITELPDPSASDYLSLGLIYYYNQMYSESDAAFTKVLELAPNSPDAYYMKAKCQLYIDQEQSTASAKEPYTKYLEMVAGNEEANKKKVIDAKLYLARIAIKNDNDKATAKQLLDEVKSLDPENADADELLKFTE